MPLPNDSVAANTLPEVTTIPTGKKLIFTDPDTNEGGIITLENLTKQILQNLTSQTFSLDQGTKTLVQALNELNSKTKITEKSGESTTDGYLNSALLIDINGMYRDLNTLNFRVNKSITKEMPGACNFGIRKVIAYDDNNYLVYIVEFYPIPGRIWTNKYIKKIGWTGWKSQERQS